MKDVRELLRALSRVDLQKDSRVYVSLLPDASWLEEPEDAVASGLQPTSPPDASGLRRDGGGAAAVVSNLRRRAEDKLRTGGNVVVFFSPKRSSPRSEEEQRSENEAPLEEGAVFLCSISSPVLLNAFQALFVENPVVGKAHLETVAAEIKRQASQQLSHNLAAPSSK